MEMPDLQYNNILLILISLLIRQQQLLALVIRRLFLKTNLLIFRYSISNSDFNKSEQTNDNDDDNGLTVSLVVEHDVGSPDLVGWNSNELDPIKLPGHPPQLVVIPNLRERRRETSFRAHCRANHLFCIFHCTLQTVLFTGDIPLRGNIFGIHIYTSSRTSFDVLQ